MGKFLIVSHVDKLQEHSAIAQKYGVGFEFNDFYMPEILLDKKRQQEIIEWYMAEGLPEYCTMHGAFFDVIVYSYDEEIRSISRKRMIQSMNIASKINAKGVVFHTNTNPFLTSEESDRRIIRYTVDFMSEILKRYPDINIYLENMFDGSPDILAKISKKLVTYDNYGVCFDYAHASISTTPMEEWISSLKKYIKHVHINDNDLKNDLHLPVGDGKIDWNAFKVYYDKYFKESTILIETRLPENQIKSLEFIKNNLKIEI